MWEKVEFRDGRESPYTGAAWWCRASDRRKWLVDLVPNIPLRETFFWLNTHSVRIAVCNDFGDLVPVEKTKD